VFYVMISCDIIAALMALFWLKPLSARTLAIVDARPSPRLEEARATVGKDVA